jgi:predicted transcriptional regulator
MNNLNNHQLEIGRHQVIGAVRALMPPRALENHEARFVAERQARRLTQLLDLSGPIVDLGPIASLPRLDVRTRAGLPVSGFSEWSRSRWVIALNEDDHPTRQRFTLAHELKHVLDNPFIEVLYPGRDGKPSATRAEAICDYFAACLLMPRPAVKALWGLRHQRVDDLAAHFGVSRAAMGLRLHQLGLSSTRARCRPFPSIRYERPGIPPSFAVQSAQKLESCT